MPEVKFGDGLWRIVQQTLMLGQPGSRHDQAPLNGPATVSKCSAPSMESLQYALLISGLRAYFGHWRLRDPHHNRGAAMSLTSRY
jgi:hypothetical protein